MAQANNSSGGGVSLSVPTRQTKGSRSLVLLLLDGVLPAALVTALITFGLLLPGLFFTPENLLGILRYAALGGIVVAGFSLALIAGQIDFSTVQVGILTSAVFAALYQYQSWPLLPALIVALLVAAACGLLSAFIINFLKVPSLVTTLAVGVLALGLSYVIFDLYGATGSLRLSRPPVRSIATAAPLGIPIAVWTMLLIYGISYGVLNYTRFGAHLYAVGGNAQAARVSGIRVEWVITAVMVTVALLTGLATLLFSGRNITVSPSAAVISAPLAAVFLAGVSLAGGAGRLERTLLAVLFFAVLGIGLSLLALPAFVRVTLEGSVFVLALLGESARQHLETR